MAKKNHADRIPLLIMGKKFTKFKKGSVTGHITSVPMEGKGEGIACTLSVEISMQREQIIHIHQKNKNSPMKNRGKISQHQT